MEPLLAEMLKPELAVGEQVRWMGTPSPSALLLRALPSVVLGSVFATAPFASNTISGRGTLTNAFGLSLDVMFAVFGINHVRWALLDVCAARKTVYAVTDRRIVIVQRAFGKRVRTYAPTAINILEHRACADGSGSVLFREEDVHGLDASGTQKFGFRGVQDVAGAVRALDQLRAQPIQ